jgi:hypothetical protein
MRGAAMQLIIGNKYTTNDPWDYLIYAADLSKFGACADLRYCFVANDGYVLHFSDEDLIEFDVREYED